MMVDFQVGLVISKKELENYNGVYEYWVRMPDRKIETFNIKTDKIEVGHKVKVQQQEDNTYKVLGIL